MYAQRHVAIKRSISCLFSFVLCVDARRSPEVLLTAGPDNIDPEPSPLFTNLTPKAGDFLFCSENLTQCVVSSVSSRTSVCIVAA